MKVGRETIMTALVALLATATGFKTGPLRRLQLWSQVANQPAIFVRNAGDDYPARPINGLPAKTTMHVEIWIYAKVGIDPSGVPGVVINGLVDAVEAVLQPTAATAGRQTLGGLVSHCWIEGRIEMDPGDLDGQAKVIIPLRILGP